MNFDRPLLGGFVEPVPVHLAALRLFLPAKLREHAHADAFLQAVADALALVADMRNGSPDQTADEARDRVRAIEAAARRMVAALHPLSTSANARTSFDAMSAHYEYMAWRARVPGPEDSDRPTVPALPPDAPTTLAQLLTRIELDLRTLEATCGATAGAINPAQRRQEKAYERRLAALIAEAHIEHFGSKPPVRGWFAAFVAEAGAVIFLDIGQRIVGEVVRGY